MIDNDLTTGLAELKIEELEVRPRTVAILQRRLEVVTIGDLLEKVKCYEEISSAFQSVGDKRLLEKLLRVLFDKGIRLRDCLAESYPNIDEYICAKLMTEVDVCSFGRSDEFVEFLKGLGCESMADVVKLNPIELINLTGDLRNEAIDYLRAMEKRRGWRLLAVSKEDYPDIDDYINENFAVNLSDLPFSTRIQNIFVKHNLSTTAQLVQYSRTDLSTQKIFGERSIAEIVRILYMYRLHLAGDIFCGCENCYKEIVKQADDEKVKFCSECQAKLKRIVKMKDYMVTVSGPDYGSYTNLSSGFTLFANIENNTDEFAEIELIDFYVFSEGRQRASLYFLNGYAFNREHIFANTSKTAGKIFATSGLKESKLSVGDYVIIKIRTNSKKFRMYKFVYTSSVFHTWRIDDYSEF